MSKRAMVRNAFQRVRSSYWFLPTVLALTAVGLAQLTLYIDRNPSSAFYFWPEGWQSTDVPGARATLSVIAQSVLGVVGVMFSVTIVAVSFASGNFGPRLIGNFMRDRGTQWSLGILIGTFVFAILILRAVQSADTGANDAFDQFVPHMSLGFAMTLVGVSIMTVIYYVHHIPETINVSNISADLGKRLRLSLEKMIDGRTTEREAGSIPEHDPDFRLSLDADGYVQTYDQSRLKELAEEHDLYVNIQLKAGEFVNAYSQVAEVWHADDWSDDIADEIRGCFVIGMTPTEDQNLLFIVQQLVEMIARALSPGVNDPYTAINCLNWLYAGLTTASNYEGGLSEYQAERVFTHSLSFEDIFDKGISQSWAYVKTDALASAHLKAMLERLTNELVSKSDRASVEHFLSEMKTTQK